jgi:3-oxocholest-4-en-26-oyl-CoA dehydrogenase alpha subunit
MDFEFSAEELEFRTRAREYIRAQCKPGVINEDADGTRFVDTPVRREFMRAMAAAGYLGVSWPKEYGGRGLPLIYDYHLAEEIAAAGAPQIGKGVGIIGRTLIAHGSEFLKQQFLPKILNAEIEFAIGYSEPDAGSDLASLKLRATREGNGWRINGQKRFTTSGHFADWYLLAARTSTEGPKHKGITLFLTPMKAPNIQVNGMPTLDGERTNEVFLDNVFIGDEYVIGEVNRGFYYISEALDFERHTLFSFAMLERIFAVYLDYVRTVSRNGRPLRADPVVRRTTARLASEVEIARMHSLRVVDAVVHGRSSNIEAAMGKIWWSELYQRIANAAIEIAGPGGWLKLHTPEAPAKGYFQMLYPSAVLPTIGAGANEISRNIIARRGLGLPNPT